MRSLFYLIKLVYSLMCALHHFAWCTVPSSLQQIQSITPNPNMMSLLANGYDVKNVSWTQRFALWPCIPVCSQNLDEGTSKLIVWHQCEPYNFHNHLWILNDSESDWTREVQPPILPTRNSQRVPAGQHLFLKKGTVLQLTSYAGLDVKGCPPVWCR